MYRPKKFKVFEAANPEYSLIDAMTSEVFENYSTEIAYWSFNRTDSDADRDELDDVYGESGGADGLNVYDGPHEVYGALEINPIIQELTRLGLEQIEEVDFYCNIAAMDNYMNGVIPKGGDIMRVTYIETNNDRRFIWYSIANVTPVDLYNFRYINYLINCEQTTLHEVPQVIKDYYEGR